jgi:hypothetical protein
VTRITGKLHNGAIIVLRSRKGVEVRNIMTPVRQPTFLDVVLLFVGLWLLSNTVRLLRRRAKRTPLKGPASKSWIFGNSHFLTTQKDNAVVYEEWARMYGDVFRVPIALGRTRVHLCDPKAIQHFYSKETYTQNASTKIFIENLVIWFYMPQSFAG